MPERTTILVLLLAGGAGAAVLALRWARERRRERRRARPNGAAIVEQPTPTAPLVDEARREFTDVADKFSGLYEPLHEACAARPDPEECRMVLSEWELRLTHSGEALRHEWQSAVREATGSNSFGNSEAADPEDAVSLGATWLDLLRRWGVERDERATFPFDENERGRYRVSGSPQLGDTFNIELPCWTHDGVVLERGVARASEETD